MSEKININNPTDPDALWRIMDKQSDQAVYWYNKKIGGERGEQRKKAEAARLIRQDTHHRSQEVFHTEWQSSPDADKQNRWLVASILHDSNEGEYDYNEKWWAAAFYESHGSIGFAIQSCDSNPDGKEKHGCIVAPNQFILVFDTHFFLRYCDPDTRNLGTMHADKQQVIIDFLTRNHVLCMPGTVNVYSGKGTNTHLYVDIAMAGCVGRGIVIQGKEATVYWIKTCLSYKMLHPKQYRVCSSILQAWYDFHKDKTDAYSDASNPSPTEASEVMTINSVKKYDFSPSNRMTLKTIGDIRAATIRRNAKSYNCSEDEFFEVLIYYSQTAVLIERMTDSVLPRTPDGMRYLFEQARKLVRWWKYKRSNTFYTDEPKVCSELLDEFDKLIKNALRHYSLIPRYTLQDILEDYSFYALRPEIIDEIKARNEKSINRTNNNQVMNSAQITAFKALTKKNLKNFFNTLLPLCYKSNADSYLQKVEVLFPLSRVLPYVTNDNDRTKLIATNKLWIEQVIDNDWSSVLTPYINRYGKELTTLALHDIIDHNNYPSPRGTNQLDSHAFDYTSFEIIDEAATCICDNEDIQPQPVTPATVSEASASDNTTPLTPNTPATVSEASASDNITPPTPNTPAASAINTPAPLVDFVIDPSDDLHVSITEAEQELAKMTFAISRLKTFVSGVNPDSDQASAQSAKLLLENERLQRQYDQKKADADKYKTERDNNQTKINALSNDLNKLRQEKDKAANEILDLKKTLKLQGDQLKTANTKYNELQAAIRDNVQRISLQELRDECPYIGKTSITSLIQFFSKKYNIIIE